jgi:hypothetical protein
MRKLLCPLVISAQARTGGPAFFVCTSEPGTLAGVLYTAENNSRPPTWAAAAAGPRGCVGFPCVKLQSYCGPDDLDTAIMLLINSCRRFFARGDVGLPELVGLVGSETFPG